MHDKLTTAFYAALIVLLLCGYSFWWVAGAYFEARSYNRLTGEQVTTWDALWLELRVER